MILQIDVITIARKTPGGGKVTIRSMRMHCGRADRALEVIPVLLSVSTVRSGSVHFLLHQQSNLIESSLIFIFHLPLRRLSFQSTI